MNRLTEKTEKTENGRKKAAENNPFGIAAAGKCINHERSCQYGATKRGAKRPGFFKRCTICRYSVFSVSLKKPRSQSSEFSFLVCVLFLCEADLQGQYNTDFLFCQGGENEKSGHAEKEKAIISYVSTELSGFLLAFSATRWYHSTKIPNLSGKTRRVKLFVVRSDYDKGEAAPDPD